MMQLLFRTYLTLRNRASQLAWLFFTCMTLTLSAIATASTHSSEQSSSVPARKFPLETLYSLLTAEIAGSRQQFDVALSLYSQQAKSTRDPQIAARATMIARYLNATEIGVEMSLLWLETAPKDKEALANASLALLQAGRIQEAFDVSKRLYVLGGEPYFQLIATAAAALNKPQRERLLQGYRNFLPRYNHDEQILVGIGQLYQQQGNAQEAMNYADKALYLYPRSLPAAMLQANLLHDLKRDKEAMAKMSNLLAYYPENLELRNQYAHILMQYNPTFAQQQFTIIAQQQPQNSEAVLALAIIAMERKDFKSASKAFEKLLDNETHSSTAHYYLGRIAESQQNWEEAIFNYLQVADGDEFLTATSSLLDIFINRGDLISAQDHINRLRIRQPKLFEDLCLLHAQVLVKHSHFIEAESVLSEAIKTLPNSEKLLMERAELFGKTAKNADKERDLRRIIQLNPDNTDALNALGFLLADASQNLREAQELLTKAHLSKPDDPTIIDSLGWLYFRTGNLTEALRHLRQAYASDQDPAVAAHLGEVLWTNGNREEARQIWQAGIRQAPDDTSIRATMKRLKADQTN